MAQFSRWASKARNSTKHRKSIVNELQRRDWHPCGGKILKAKTGKYRPMTNEYVIYGCGSGIFIPDPEFSILDRGSKKHRIPSSDPRQRGWSIFNPQKWYYILGNIIRDNYPESEYTRSGSGVLKNHWIPDPDPLHWLLCYKIDWWPKESFLLAQFFSTRWRLIVPARQSCPAFFFFPETMTEIAPEFLIIQ